MIFKGSATALITPFHEDFSVHKEKFVELIERQIAGGIQALVINGTTAEASTLSFQERTDCLQTALEVIQGRVPVIAGTGSNNTIDALAATIAAQEQGADAAMLVTPYYNKTSQAGLIAHFTYIADRTNLPILLYAVPSRTGQPMDVETVLELAKHPRIVGLKDATGNATYLMDILRQVENPDFAVYSGNDDAILPYIAAGASGVISTVGNLFPSQVEALCQLAFSGEISRAQKAQYDLLPVIHGVFAEVNPIGTKGGMNLLGLEVGSPRLPLVPMGKATYQNLESVLKTYSFSGELS